LSRRGWLMKRGKVVEALERQFDAEIRALEERLQELNAKIRNRELTGFDLGQALAEVRRLPGELADLRWRRFIARQGEQ